MGKEPINLSMDADPVEAPEPDTKAPVARKKRPKRAPKKSKADPVAPPLDLARQIGRVNPMGDASGNMARYNLVLRRPAVLDEGPKTTKEFWTRIDSWPKTRKKKK